MTGSAVGAGGEGDNMTGNQGGEGEDFSELKEKMAGRGIGLYDGASACRLDESEAAAAVNLERRIAGRSKVWRGNEAGVFPVVVGQSLIRSRFDVGDEVAENRPGKAGEGEEDDDEREEDLQITVEAGATGKPRRKSEEEEI